MLLSVEAGPRAVVNCESAKSEIYLAGVQLLTRGDALSKETSSPIQMSEQSKSLTFPGFDPNRVGG